MKTIFSTFIICLVAVVVVWTTVFFLHRALFDSNATWRLVDRAWGHVVSARTEEAFSRGAHTIKLQTMCARYLLPIYSSGSTTSLDQFRGCVSNDDWL